MNKVMMQYFEWYVPADQEHWIRLAQDAQALAELGVGHVWMPPAFKATSPEDVGYGIYDLYDLGEFDQKGSVATKYGTKDQYLEAIQALKQVGIRPIADIVLNHKANADHKERFFVRAMNPQNRQEALSEPFEMEGWTGFSFPGRQNQYSDFHWHWYHFSGTDYNASTGETGIYMIQGEAKGWAANETVDQEMGNYDYLMYADIDYRHPQVKEETARWMDWFVTTTGVEGFRMDAVKHIDASYMKEFLALARQRYGESFYIFGEYWQADLANKEHYLAQTDYQMDLVDVKLHQNFYEIGQNGPGYDLRQMFEGTLMQEEECLAVTFVDNHDTQAGQALESQVADWFKPSAYATLLTRKQGLPCLFYGDYYGVGGRQETPFKGHIDYLMGIRQAYAYGDQLDFFNQKDLIAWARLGDQYHPGQLVTLISTGEGGQNTQIDLGPSFAGKVFKDPSGNFDHLIELDQEGKGDFCVKPGSYACWVTI